MKRFIYIIMSVCYIFSLTSCIDDILSKKPLDSISDDVVWKDKTMLTAFINQQYMLTTVFVNEASTFVGGWGKNSPVDNKWDIYHSKQGFGAACFSNIADESTEGWDASGTKKFKIGHLNVNGGFSEWWEYPYYIIRNINNIIAHLENSTFDETFKIQKLAEARFIRAYNYFSMVKRYGGVPLITKVTELDAPEEEIYPKRNSEQEIYDYIISEMDAIADDLKEVKAPGVANKYTVLALKSRAALYAGSIAQFGKGKQLDGILGIPADEAQSYYDKSYKASLEIINSGIYSLYNVNSDKVQNFKDLFVKKNHTEAIFVVQHNYSSFMDGSGATWGYDFVQQPKPHGWNLGMCCCPYLEMAEEFEYVDGRSGKLDRNAIQQGLWSMDDLWKNKDPRFYASIYTNESPWKGGKVDFHNGILDDSGNLHQGSGQGFGGVDANGTQNIFGNNFGTGFGVLKYLEEDLPVGTTWSNSGTDYMVFRYAEILLNAAEAGFELGKTSESLDFINQVRKRAGISTLTNLTRDAIRHERKVELAFEAHRYWDVRRWRVAEKELTGDFSGLRYILDYNTRKYKLVVLEKIDGKTSPIFHSHNYYFPITHKRTGENKNLLENPGYEN